MTRPAVLGTLFPTKMGAMGEPAMLTLNLPLPRLPRSVWMTLYSPRRHLGRPWTSLRCPSVFTITGTGSDPVQSRECTPQCSRPIS